MIYILGLALIGIVRVCILRNICLIIKVYILGDISHIVKIWILGENISYNISVCMYVR